MKFGSSMLSASCLCAVIIGAFSFQHSRVGISQSLRPFARKGLIINTKLVNEDSQPMISIIEESRKYDNVGSIDSWMTPENVAILSVYFVQGALGLSRLGEISCILKAYLFLLDICLYFLFKPYHSFAKINCIFHPLKWQVRLVPSFEYQLS